MAQSSGKFRRESSFFEERNGCVLCRLRYVPYQNQLYGFIPPRVQPADSVKNTALLAEATAPTQPNKSPPQQRSRGKANLERIPSTTAVFFEYVLFSLDIDRSHRCCSRPLWGTSRSCSRPRHEPGQPRREDESTRTLEAARTRARPGMGQGPSTAPPSADRRGCLLYTSPSPRDLSTSRMPSSA